MKIASFWIKDMVLILDGTSDTVTHVWSDLGYLIWLRHLIRSRVATNRISLMRAQHVMRYHLISVGGGGGIIKMHN